MMLCRANFLVLSLVLLHHFKRLLTICILLIRSQLFATVFVPFRLVDSFCLTRTHGKLLIRCFFHFHLVTSLGGLMVYISLILCTEMVCTLKASKATPLRIWPIFPTDGPVVKNRELIDSKMLAINNSPETLCNSSQRNKLLFDGRNTNFTFGVEW